MNRGGRTGGRRHAPEKQSHNSESMNSKNRDNLCSYMRHEFVRCHLTNGAVYCGYVKSFAFDSDIVLYHPYIEQSPVDYSQPSPKSELSVNIRDIYKVSTQNSVKCAQQQTSPSTLQVGIMESLFLSASDAPEAPTSSPAFDDVDRRQRARNVTSHRELENNFDFLTTSQEMDELEEKNFRMGAYDQFAENQSKFGVKSDFDMTVYTTYVNSAEVPEDLRIAAERMERELHSSRDTTNIHILEERGVIMNVDEEERYSRVHSGNDSGNGTGTGTRPGRSGRPAPSTSTRSGECELTRDIMKKDPEGAKQPAKIPQAPILTPASSTPSFTVTAPSAPSTTTTTTPTPSIPSTPSTPAVVTKPSTSTTSEKKLNPAAREFKMNASAPEFTMKSVPALPMQMMPQGMMMPRQAVMTPQGMMMPVMMPQGMMMHNQVAQGPNGQPVLVPGYRYPVPMNVNGYMPNGYVPMGQAPTASATPMVKPTTTPAQNTNQS